MDSGHGTPIEGIAIVVSDARSGDLPGSRCSMRSISTLLEMVVSYLDRVTGRVDARGMRQLSIYGSTVCIFCWFKTCDICKTGTDCGSVDVLLDSMTVTMTAQEAGSTKES